jgi:hypothetical protein
VYLLVLWHLEVDIEWFYSSTMMKTGHSFLVVTIIVVITGYAFFGVGICEAYTAFSKQFQ